MGGKIPFFKTLLIGVLIYFLLCTLLFALIPPTKEQIEKYKQDHSWAQRVAMAKALGNHKASASLVARAHYRLKRMALELQGNTGEAIDTVMTPPPVWVGMPTKGTVKVLALLIDFSDNPAISTASSIQEKLFGNGKAADYPCDSLRNFYRRSSYNQLEITGNVLGWYTTPYPRSSIPQTDAGRDNLIKEVLNYYDSQGHDFTQYDSDNDGMIDNFIVIWAGPPGQWATFWWAFKQYFRDPSYLIDGKGLFHFIWQFESYQYPAGEFSARVTIHETGHALGLPDYYDYDNTVGPNGGVGHLDMMDGNWGDHNCFSKFLLDWFTPSVYNSGTRTVTLRASGSYPDAVIFMPGASAGQSYYEFFMVQNRYRTANDSDTLGIGYPYPADGLLIWHVDARLNAKGTNFEYDNSYTAHKLLRLMEADGLEEIETGDGTADAGDYYTQGSHLGPGTTPSSSRYDGTSTQMGVRNISAAGSAMTCEIYGAAGIPTISLDKTVLNFGHEVNGNTTSSQLVLISNTGQGILNWSVSDDAAWLSCTTTAGTDAGAFEAVANAAGLSPGVYQGAITVSDPNASNSPQTIAVKLEVFSPGITSPPFGFFSTPLEGSTVSSSIPVTGWALDDIEVMSVKIYNGTSFVGDAVFIEGARPGVATAYPGFPLNYKAGWGYMLLTNFLPNGGNGTYTLYATATDAEGNQVSLGSKTIIVDNANAIKPFGAIDEPKQGERIKGSKFVNGGWVLTPQPNHIPLDGSTITVWIDGVLLGNPGYNIARSDVAGLFPGYANSNGPGGRFTFDTTTYSDGLHTIYWIATDSAGNADGIGSRFFFVLNNPAARGIPNTLSVTAVNLLNRLRQLTGQKIDDIRDIPVDHRIPVKVRKGFDPNSLTRAIYPDKNGIIDIEIRELERLELDFSNESAFIRHLSGYQAVGDRFLPLPGGTTLDTGKGKFYWQPGPGFYGDYRFIFFKKGEITTPHKKRTDEELYRLEIIVRIGPRFE